MRFLLIALLACLPCGCSDPPAEPAGGTSQPTSETAQPSVDVDALMDLPYAGDSDVDEDADEGVVFRSQDMQPGYTLLIVHKSCRVELIDEDGKVVRSWSDPDGRHWDNAELLPNGDLILVGGDPADVSGIADEARYAMRFDFAGNLLWKRKLLVHHDITRDPDGNLIALSFVRRQEADYPKADLRDDCILTLNQQGEPLASQCLYDAVKAAPDVFPLRPKKANARSGKAWVDLFHLNSLEWMQRPDLVDEHPLYGLDNVLVCSRHQNRIAVINMKTGALVWAWGKGELDGPHDASVLANGNILLFDNGLARGWSRGLEIDPRTNEIVWSFDYEEDKQPGDRKNKKFFSGSKGSAQRLANGNTLLCSADRGEVFEVSPEGKILWRYYCTEVSTRDDGSKRRASLVRAYRLDRTWIDGLLNEE